MSVPYRSVFAQLPQFVPRAEFDPLARKHRHEAHSKGFPSHTQFVAMLFMQLGQADSLREIELGLGSIYNQVHLDSTGGARVQVGTMGRTNRTEWVESALGPSTLQRESQPHHQVPLDSSFYTTPKQGVGDGVK